jgi:hypothetical protein
VSGLFEAVAEFINDNYPVTVREIYGNIPFAEASIRVAVSEMRRKGAKRFYISGWVWEDYGHMLRCLPQYAPGNHGDVPKPPKRTMQQHRRRHMAKKRVRVNSVFSLGVKIDDRRTTTRKREDLKIAA